MGPGAPEYEALRTRFFNARVPNTKPAKIFTLRTTFNVAEIIKQARADNSNICVQSGGHLFPCSSLVQGGVLINTCHFNQGIEYDHQTQLVSFPLGDQFKELADSLTAVGRFFPFGNSPTVAAGGFLLAGRQGWFMRGWGCTFDSWVERMEIVTGDGKIVQSSQTEYTGLFWAARGSGQGFFGVVTRIWGKPIPTRRLWEMVAVFDVTRSFTEVLRALFELSDRTPKYVVEIAFASFRPHRDEPGCCEGVRDTRVFLAASALVFAATLPEAKALLVTWAHLPRVLRKNAVATWPIIQRSWDELYKAQEALILQGMWRGINVTASWIVLG